MASDKTCPKCGGAFERRADQFFWRGKFFHGLVCAPCNSLWDDPDDSFEAAVGIAPKKEP